LTTNSKQNQLTRMRFSGYTMLFSGIEDCQDLFRFENKNSPMNRGLDREKRDSAIIPATLKRLASYKWEDSEMPAKGPRPFLVKSAPEKMAKQARFHTEEIVRQSGIYRVRHKKHRLPHEVSLFRDQRFPRCAQCADAVTFELVRAATDEVEAASSSRICLYELPVLEDDEAAKAG
jgi:hypothetical protein